MNCQSQATTAQVPLIIHPILVDNMSMDYLPNLDRLDRLPASGLDRVQEQGGMGTSGIHLLGENYAHKFHGPVAHALLSTTG